MAHIPDGVLSAEVLIAGAALTGVGLIIGLRRLDAERIPPAALLAAAFFVASLIRIPLGPGSVHLMLNGLMGLVLGWAAVPAILVALVLQMVFFGFGGLLSLGVNGLNIALPALLCAALFGPLLARASPRRIGLLGALAGGLSVALTAAMVALSLALSGRELAGAAQILLISYLPLVLVEALVSGATLSFVYRVAPELLQACQRPPT